jgi:hypothetical protein
MTDYECTEEIFLENIKNHKLTVLLDNGIYKHLRFKSKDTNSYYFDIVTYPNHLVISGDMGCLVASRIPDMFEFYRTDRNYMLKDGRKLAINPSYWAEKIVSGKDDIKEFSINKLKKNVTEYIDSCLFGEDWSENEIDLLKCDILSAIDYTDNNSSDCMFDMIDSFQYYKDKTPYSDNPDFEFTDWWEYHGYCEEFTFHYIWNCYAIAYAVQEYDKLRQGELSIE